MSDASPRHLVLPTLLVWRGDEPIVTFAEVEVESLARPFWHQTIDTPRRIVAIAPLDDFAPLAPSVRIAGFIFHMTRCGSTLAARQFSALPRTYAISEPFAFQHLLDHPDDDLERRSRRLVTLLAAHVQSLSPLADALVIKWSGLTGLHAAEIAGALPAVPGVFLHRDPAEVLASIAAAPLGGAEYVTSRHLGSHAPADFAVRRCQPLELSALVIANICDRLALAGSLRTLDYTDLPRAIGSTLADHFGFTIGDPERAAMALAAKPHAKHAARGAPFTGDAWREVELRSAPVCDLADRVVGPALAACLSRLQPLSRALPDSEEIGAAKISLAKHAASD